MLVSIVIVLVLVVLNGFFALSELAIVSARRARLETMAKAGNRGAARALQLAEDPTSFLSTVQVGITLIGIFAGAYSTGNQLVIQGIALSVADLGSATAILGYHVTHPRRLWFSLSSFKTYARDCPIPNLLLLPQCRSAASRARPATAPTRKPASIT